MGEREAEPKRGREEGEEERTEGKRRRQQQRSPYRHILSSLLLEEEQAEEGGEVFRSIMSALELELCCSSSGEKTPVESSDRLEEAFDDAAGEMRRLFDASDDELGIPPTGSPTTAAAAGAAEEEGAAAGGADDAAAAVAGGGGGWHLWAENLQVDGFPSGCYGHHDDDDDYALPMHADVFF